MDVRIVSGGPTPIEAQVIERAFAILEAEGRAQQANSRQGRRDGWTMSGRLAAHGAAASLQRVR